MFAIGAAVLFAIVQTRTAQVARGKATAARRKALAALAAKAQSDDAIEEALAELDRVRAQTAAQLSAYQSVTEEANTVRAELAEVRAAAVKAVADAQAQVKILQNQLDAAKAEATQLVEATREERADPTTLIRAETGKANTERTAGLDHGGHDGTASGASRASGPSGRRGSKMTPELIDKAQRMYTSRRFTVAEIAQACSVSPTTIYRHIHTRPDHDMVATRGRGFPLNNG